MSMKAVLFVFVLSVSVCPIPMSGLNIQWGTPDVPLEQQDFTNAMQQPDLSDKISSLEAFLQAYPNSAKKEAAFRELVSALQEQMIRYRNAGDTERLTETARRLLQLDPNNKSAQDVRQVSKPPNLIELPPVNRPSESAPAPSTEQVQQDVEKPKDAGPTVQVRNPWIDPTVIAALIAACATILGAYWQFVYRPRGDKRRKKAGVHGTSPRLPPV
jgi:hypothetical protein